MVLDSSKIKELSKTDRIPYDLLYLADPSKEAAEDYIGRGACYLTIIEVAGNNQAKVLKVGTGSCGTS